MMWSPWEKLDPELKRNYGGAESGKGATYDWQGKKAGTGRMEIIEAEPVFEDPDQARFHEAVRGAQHRRVHVHAARRRHQGRLGDVWPNIFMAKVMSIFFVSTDKLVGKDFEKGLAEIKAAAEK